MKIRLLRPALPLAALAILLLYSCEKSVPLSSTSPVTDGGLSTTVANTSVTATGTCDYTFNETAAIAAGYTKVFEDNFDSGLANWNIWTGGAFNNELEYYQSANLQTVNGNLVITAKKETVTGVTTPYDATPKTFSYTSGRIESKNTISASTATPKVRIVARIKLPAGYGMWPAYWSYGDPWPTQGEIDYLEARGQEPFKYQTNYFYGRASGRNLVKNQVGIITSTSSLTDCYHVYEMIWSQNSLTSIFDGNVVETKTGSYVPNMFGKTEKVVLNLAVGGDFFSNFDSSKIVTGSMYVDYVKIFTSK